MSRKKFSTTVYLDADQVEQLRALSKKTKVSAAEYVRQGIDLFLAKQQERPAQLSMWNGYRWLGGKP